MFDKLRNRLHNICMVESMPNETFTMQDIAEELGISRSTVSRALSDSSRISRFTKDKVRDCAARHGFTPNLVARALASKKTFNIAAVLPMEATAMQVSFFHECLSGIVSRSSKAGYSVLICMTVDNDLSILKNSIQNKKVDAFILTQLKRNDKALELIQKSGIPFVVIGSSEQDVVIQVDSRMEENCRSFTVKCVRNLAPEQKVLFVCGSLDVEANNKRLSGFLSGMENAGFEQKRFAVCTDVQDITDEISPGAWDLILCSDDIVCLKVMDELSKQNLTIGKDVGLASFHDSVFLQQAEIPVSALRVDAFALGSEAADVALERLSGHQVQNHNYVDASFMMRNSTL